MRGLRFWLAIVVICAGSVPTMGASSSDRGLAGLASLASRCRPYVAVSYHVDRSGGRIADHVWVESSSGAAQDKAVSLRAKVRGDYLRVEPAFGVRVFTAIVLHESGGHPWIIGDNGPPHASYTFATREEAEAKAEDLYAMGHRNLDLGLAQINSGNLAGYGLDLESVFDQCTNLRTGGMILAHGYYGAADVAGYGAEALRMALSAYNTNHYYAQAGQEYAESVWDIARWLPPNIGAGDGERYVQ